MGKSLRGKELGTGIVQRNTDGMYVGRFVSKVTGKRVTITSKDLKVLKEKLCEAKENDRKGIGCVAPNQTLNDWFEVWTELYKRDKVRNTTFREYRFTYALVRDSLGSRRLSEIKNTDIQKAMNTLPSDASREKVRKLLSDMFKRAVVNRYIPSNPVEGVVTKQEGKKEDPRFLTEYEDELFFRFAKKYLRTNYNALKLMRETGMRCGEVLGLQWKYVNLDKKYLEVKKTLVYCSDGAGATISELHEPKSYASERRVYLTDEAISILQEEYSNRNDEGGEFKDLVFKSSNNGPVKHHSITNSINIVLKKIQEETGEEIEHFTPHTLRHTFATRAIAKGMYPKILQRILGHSSIKMTMDLYCHVSDESMIEAMQLMNG